MGGTLGDPGTHRGDLQEAVGAPAEVGEARDPTEIPLQLLRQAAGVEQLGLEGAQQLLVAAPEALGQAHGVLELLPQLPSLRVPLRAVCGAHGTLSTPVLSPQKEGFVSHSLPPKKH